MNKIDNGTFEFLKLSYLLLVSFVEMAKPYLTDKDYVFYKQIIKDIDFKKNVYNLSSYFEFVMKEVYNHCNF